jgi:flagellar hook-basal body complex protein FliE
MELTKAGMSVIPSIGGVGNVAGAQPAAGASFSDILKATVGQAVDAQKEAGALTLAAAQGQPVAMNDVIQAVSKAELTLQTLVSVRDKAVEAYQQIVQMPV